MAGECLIPSQTILDSCFTADISDKILGEKKVIAIYPFKKQSSFILCSSVHSNITHQYNTYLDLS